MFLRLRGWGSGVRRAGLGMPGGDVLQGRCSDPGCPELVGLQGPDREVVKMTEGGVNCSKEPSSSRPVLFTSGPG